ncbi:glycosyltransferase [Roseovarius sp.]|uniref:glycosyltransferase n=1 Tax=Roseovarius sp. TaxID=1486281 RepID=UPI00351148AC
MAVRYPDRVALFVMDGQGDVRDDASTLRIVDLGGRPRGRIGRVLKGNWRAFGAVRAAAPRIAQFHDPELIPAALMLKLFGIKVIYDIHENVPNQVLSKAYIRPAMLRQAVSRVVRAFEGFAVRRFDAAVVAVESIGRRFPQQKVVLIRNFPRADLMLRSREPANPKQRFIVSYAGSLTRVRGIPDLVAAMEHLPEQVELQLFGTWHPAALEDTCRAMPGWSKCKFLGRVPHDELVVRMQEAHLGVQLTHDIPNHTGGLATKVFEYLFLGIPVVVSDTAEKRAIYGELVDYAEPANPVSIANAVRGIVADYEHAQARARNNAARVRETYSWEAEAVRLGALYDRLMAPADPR